MKSFLAVILLTTALTSLARSQQPIQGDWPQGGGPLTVYPTGDPLVTRGLDIAAKGPFLTQGSNPAPYEFFLTNLGQPAPDLEQVVIGGLNNVTIGGPITLDVMVSPLAGCGDISVTWGDGAVPVEYVLTPSFCIPEPSAGCLALVGLVPIFCCRSRRRTSLIIKTYTT